MSRDPVPSPPVNVARRLAEMAAARPDSVAVAEPLDYGKDGRRRYRTMTFYELDRDSDRVAAGLRGIGASPGSRLALLVRPGVDFMACVFGMLKAGVVMVLIDPGMGRKNLIRCLESTEPEGFVAISAVQAVRTLLRHRFAKAKLNVTAGRRWFWGGATLAEFRRAAYPGPQMADTQADDPAAIIFTTGSTGPPKGVCYRHETFDSQVDQIQRFFDIRPGEVDVPGFPMFGLFNCAMGVTAVIPEMDFTRPAKVDPAKFVEAIEDWKASQSFASPAVWNRVGPYCEARGIRLDTLRRVLSSGAPIPIRVLERMKRCIHPEGDVHTPYGATEALPVASIAASEVLAETAEKSRKGAGTCVGRRFADVAWKVIRVVEGPIETLADAEELPSGEIGELIVSGPAVTREYRANPGANALGKTREGSRIWHRMGDVGYLDREDRFWMCGRLAHRVVAEEGPMYTVPCEAVFNEHPRVFRSALVGVGPKGRQRPVMIVELHPDEAPRTKAGREAFLDELRELAKGNPITAGITDFRIHPSMPVDIRHNAKIFREKLAVWAAS